MKSIYIILFTLCLWSCDKDKSISTTLETSFLTNGNSKNWNIVKELPERIDEECRPGASFVLDNSWTFFVNGTLQFNNGNLKGNSRCSDYVNFTGHWMIEDNYLKITAAKGTDNAETSFNNQIMVYGRIEQLDENLLVLSRNGNVITFQVKSTSDL